MLASISTCYPSDHARSCIAKLLRTRRFLRYEATAGSAMGICHLPWGKGHSFKGELVVTLERGETDGEEASGLGLRIPVLLDGLNYSLAYDF